MAHDLVSLDNWVLLVMALLYFPMTEHMDIGHHGLSICASNLSQRIVPRGPMIEPASHCDIHLGRTRLATTASASLRPQPMSPGRRQRLAMMEIVCRIIR